MKKLKKEWGILGMLLLSFLFLTACSSTEQKEANELKKQEDLLIVFTQQDAEKFGVELPYKGKDTWNVAKQKYEDTARWVITTDDNSLGRVKSIYEWTGNEDDGATLIYLLINGEEYINKMD